MMQFKYGAGVISPNRVSLYVLEGLFISVFIYMMKNASF